MLRKLRVSSKPQQTKSFCFHALSLSLPYHRPHFFSCAMSTRSKTRSSLSSKASDLVNSAPKARGRTLTLDDDMDVDTHTGEGKENMQAVASKTSMGPPLRTTRKSKPRKARTRESLRTVDCICSKGDDGSPMVFCSQCQIWYVSVPLQVFTVIV